MWFHPLLNHGFWGDYCSLCQGFTYWNRASLQPVAWFWLTPGVCARGYLWHPVTLTPAASSTLASWAADRPWRLCMLRGWTLGEGNINFIKYIWHIYDGHMSDVCVYIYISVCVCVCVGWGFRPCYIYPLWNILRPTWPTWSTHSTAEVTRYHVGTCFYDHFPGHQRFGLGATWADGQEASLQ